MADQRDQHSEEPHHGGIRQAGVKKTLWFHHDEAEALRDAAYKQRCPESGIIRDAVRRYLDIED